MSKIFAPQISADNTTWRPYGNTENTLAVGVRTIWLASELQVQEMKILSLALAPSASICSMGSLAQKASTLLPVRCPPLPPLWGWDFSRDYRIWECARRTKEYNSDLRKQAAQPSPLPSLLNRTKSLYSTTSYFLYFFNGCVGRRSLWGLGMEPQWIEEWVESFFFFFFLKEKGQFTKNAAVLWEELGNAQVGLCLVFTSKTNVLNSRTSTPWKQSLRLAPDSTSVSVCQGRNLNNYSQQ